MLWWPSLFLIKLQNEDIRTSSYLLIRTDEDQEIDQKDDRKSLYHKLNDHTESIAHSRLPLQGDWSEDDMAGSRGLLSSYGRTSCHCYVEKY